MAEMDPRLVRQAHNEAMYRAVNQELERASEAVGDRQLEVLCECGQPGCRAVLEMPASEYDAVHGERDRFAVAAGHETPAIETVVARGTGYVIVDKFGAAEEIAEDAGS